MLTTDMGRDDPSVIVKPVDPTLVAQIRKKRHSYQRRMRDLPASDVAHQDAFFKKRLLDLVVGRDKVTLQTFLEDVTVRAVRNFGLNAEEVMVRLRNAWEVIHDYCHTGGQNVNKRLPSAL